jgi:hypothetical protein
VRRLSLYELAVKYVIRLGGIGAMQTPQLKINSSINTKSNQWRITIILHTNQFITKSRISHDHRNVGREDHNNLAHYQQAGSYP